MTGPEHYAEAEKLLAFRSEYHTTAEEAADAMAAAQVHATLALVDAVRPTDPAAIGKAINHAVSAGARKQVRS